MTSGTMGSEAILQSGGGSQTGYTRWGDYTAMRIDPSDDCTFWYTNEYEPANGNFNWDTRISAFTLPNCTATAANSSTAADHTGTYSAPLGSSS